MHETRPTNLLPLCLRATVVAALLVTPAWSTDARNATPPVPPPDGAGLGTPASNHPATAFSSIGAPTWILAKEATGPPGRDWRAMAYDSARGHLVAFGGSTPDAAGNPVCHADTWEWDGRAWMQRFPATSPPARARHGMAFDSARGKVVLFGGWNEPSRQLLGDTWEWDGTTWIQRFPATSPSPREVQGMTYDSTRGRVVLYGFGFLFQLGDTWEWDGNTWAARASSGGSPPLAYSVMSFDRARGRSVLHGAGWAPTGPPQTWEWDGNTWTRKLPATLPPASIGSAMAYDESRGRIVLFGNGTWEWDGTTWIHATPPAAPEISGAMAYDTRSGRVVLLGGVTRALDETKWVLTPAATWEWNGAAWAEKTPKTSPSYGGAMAFDSARGRVVLFGGDVDRDGVPDTWEWDGRTWLQETPATSPRSGGAMAFDGAHGNILFCGGDGNRDDSLDTWGWDGSTWLERTPAVSPSSRSGQEMAYDSARNRVVLYGGVRCPPDSDCNSPNLTGDTWEWDGSTWIERTPVVGPPARVEHAMAYDASRGRVFLFGGAGRDWENLPLFLADTWTWDGSAWAEVAWSPSTPAGRAGHAVAYDSARERLVLFGGYEWRSGGHQPMGTTFADTWEFDGSAWSERILAPNPGARKDHFMAYDGGRSRIVLFGGAGNDTWEYGPITGCAFAADTVEFTPGDGTGDTSAAAALGAPDDQVVSLGTDGRVVLGFDPPIASASGTDFIVHARWANDGDAGETFRVEASEDNATYVFVTDCPGGDCHVDLAPTGLRRAGYLRITDLTPPETGAASQGPGVGIDAVSVIRCGNRSPIAVAGSNHVAECTGNRQATVRFDGSASTDSDSTPGTHDDIVRFEWFEDYGGSSEAPLGEGESLLATLGLGSHAITLRVTDRGNDIATDTLTATVEDTLPPRLLLTADTILLWPPNHALRGVHVEASAIDECDPSPAIVLRAATSSEPDDVPGPGDGFTIHDIQDASFDLPDFELRLRAERQGNGPGRVYTLRYEAIDSSGGVTPATVTVVVPRDLGWVDPTITRTTCRPRYGGKPHEALNSGHLPGRPPPAGP